MISATDSKPRTRLVSTAVVLVGAIAAMLASTGVSRAETPPEKGKAFGDWVVDCEQPKDKPAVCFLSQEQTQKEGGGRVLRLSLGKLGPKGEMMVVAALPLGISLQAGAALKIDGREQKQIVLQQCTNDGCLGTLVLDKATVEALKAAKEILVGVMPFGGTQTVVIPASVKGLTGAMAFMKY